MKWRINEFMYVNESGDGMLSLVYETDDGKMLVPFHLDEIGDIVAAMRKAQAHLEDAGLVDDLAKLAQQASYLLFP